MVAVAIWCAAMMLPVRRKPPAVARPQIVKNIFVLCFWSGVGAVDAVVGY